MRDVKVLAQPLVLNKGNEPNSLNTCIAQKTHLLMCSNAFGAWGHVVGRWRECLVGCALATTCKGWLKLPQCGSCSSSINSNLWTPHRIISNLTTSKYTENNTKHVGRAWFIANHPIVWDTHTMSHTCTHLGGDESPTCAASHRAVHTLPLPHTPLIVLYEP